MTATQLLRHDANLLEVRARVEVLLRAELLFRAAALRDRAADLEAKLRASRRPARRRSA